MVLATRREAPSMLGPWLCLHSLRGRCLNREPDLCVIHSPARGDAASASLPVTGASGRPHLGFIVAMVLA